MEVDTDSFKALAADVAAIKDQLRRLDFARTLAIAETAFAAGRAPRPGRHARPRGSRPGHLRPVSDEPGPS